MKQIKVKLSDYVKAPIDDKNVLSDSIIESLFDDDNYVWEGNEAMGFVCGYPTYVNYYENKVYVDMISTYLHSFVDDAWAKAVISRIAGEDYNNENVIWKDQIIVESERQFIFAFSVCVSQEKVRVEFYYDHKKQK